MNRSASKQETKWASVVKRAWLLVGMLVVWGCTPVEANAQDSIDLHFLLTPVCGDKTASLPITGKLMVHHDSRVIPRYIESTPKYRLTLGVHHFSFEEYGRPEVRIRAAFVSSDQGGAKRPLQISFDDLRHAVVNITPDLYHHSIEFVIDSCKPGEAPTSAGEHVRTKVGILVTRQCSNDPGGDQAQLLPFSFARVSVGPDSFETDAFGYKEADILVGDWKWSVDGEGASGVGMEGRLFNGLPSKSPADREIRFMWEEYLQRLVIHTTEKCESYARYVGGTDLRLARYMVVAITSSSGTSESTIDRLDTTGRVNEGIVTKLLAAGDFVYSGDVIRTASDSQVLLQMGSILDPVNQRILIHPGATFSPYFKSTRDRGFEASYRLWGVVDQQNEWGKETIRQVWDTPNATVTDLDTVFSVGYDKTSNVTTVSVSEGRVVVRPKNVRLAAVTLTAGQQIVVGQNSVSAITKAAPPTNVDFGNGVTWATFGKPRVTRTGNIAPETKARPYYWEKVGPGDCGGRDVGSSNGAIPDDALAKEGLIAICWDGTNFKNGGRIWCTYKSDEAENCSGGGNPGNMYRSVRSMREPIDDTSLEPTSSSTPQIQNAGPAYLGCFLDNSTPERPRDLGGYEWSDSQMTTEKCVSSCKQKGYKYAATQYSAHCFCGNTYGKYGSLNGVEGRKCDMKCTGNLGQTCGGSWANSVYEVK